jgi:hypothetical protein
METDRIRDAMKMTELEKKAAKQAAQATKQETKKVRQHRSSRKRSASQRQ